MGAPRDSLSAGHEVGLDLEALALFEREVDGEVGVGRHTRPGNRF